MGRLSVLEHTPGWKAGVSETLLWMFFSGLPEERMIFSSGFEPIL